MLSGVNFINILSTNFSYECHFGSFFSSYMYVMCTWKKLLKRRSYEKCAYKVDEIDGRKTKCIFSLQVFIEQQKLIVCAEVEGLVKIKASYWGKLLFVSRRKTFCLQQSSSSTFFALIFRTNFWRQAET